MGLSTGALRLMRQLGLRRYWGVGGAKARLRLKIEKKVSGEAGSND